MNYKLTIYNNKVYKELSLTEYMEHVTVGTGKDSKVCFFKEDIGRDLEIEVIKQQNDYIVSSSQDLFFNTDSVKEKIHVLKTGESIDVCDGTTESVILSLEFSEDFGDVQGDYNLDITISGASRITIGGRNDADIIISDRTLADDIITLRRGPEGFDVDISASRYGVKVNGVNLKKKASIVLKDKQFLEYCGNFFYLEGDHLFTSDSGEIRTRLQHVDNLPQKNHFKYPQFIRSARQQYADLDEKPEILPPKTAPTEPKKNLIRILLPVILMLVLMVFVRGMLMPGNKLYIVYFAASMVISGSMSVWNYFDNGKDYRKKKANRIKVYNEYLDKKEEELTKLRNDERTLISERNRSVEETVRNISDFSARLFEKEKDHDDFLDIRVGTGRVESECQVSFRKQEYLETEDMLMDYPEKIHDKYQYIDGMPVILELGKVNAVGVIGIRDKLYQMMKNMILTVSGQHFYDDVKEFLIIDKEDVKYFDWTRWIKNFSDESTGMRFIIHDDESSKSGLEFLYGELAAREALKDKELEQFAHFVVYVYRSSKFMEHPVKEYVRNANKLGFTFVFFEEFEELLHKNCDKRMFLEPDKNHGFIQDTEDGNKIQYFDYDHISMDTVKQCAMKLAPVYVKELSLESTLTKNISFYQLLNIMNAHDLDLGKRWSESKVYESMAAPLGVKSGDEVVALDLHEKYHGPHGLVAGTTGSGKSEIMQSYILSIATLFHPYDVSFIIIDFKGGGMANQFKNLPHLNGAITNIDGKQINRSLKSIKAELIKRQELFAKYEVNQIDNYIKLYKEGRAEVPLPHLILLVDEFAELKAEQPDFMKELISTARIGRSLGVHLILATQKPSGVVNDQIWSNSKFKLCLKVQEKSDSNEVLHSPLAAEIREPGRAYLQVGNNEIFELFQSAYSGAPALVQSTNAKRKFRINSVSLSGKRKVIYEQKPEKSEASLTQLEAMVEYVNEYCTEAHIAKLDDIILPPLPEMVPYPHKLEKVGTDVTVPIGICDDPDRQAQDPFEINLSKSHYYILGSSLSGKTAMLQGMMMGITAKYSPKEVNIYIIDFASMMMKIFEGLNHVGSVVTIADEDKLKNLIKMLLEKIGRRRKLLADRGLSSFSSYREAGYKDEAQIIVFIENYTVFKATYPNYENDILAICRDGVANGISVVFTNQQMSGIGYKLMSNIAGKIALNCNDKGQYVTLFDRCRIQPDEVPGRGITKFGTELKEFQAYMAFPSEKEIDRINKIKEYIKACNHKYGSEMAEKVRFVPAELTEDFLKETCGNTEVENGKLMFGLHYAKVEPVWLDLLEGKEIAISGREDLGRSKFVDYLIGKLMNADRNGDIRLYLFDSEQRQFESAAQANNIMYYSSNAMDAIEVIEDLHDGLIREDNNDAGVSNGPVKVVVFADRKTIEVIGKEENILEKYLEIVKYSKQNKVCIMYTDVENVAVTGLANPISTHIRDEGSKIFFENPKDIALVKMPQNVITAVKVSAGMGDTFYINNSKIKRVKVPLG
ncbi:MAG: type VII secretion protein EssC [Butyrivibrio hungatei]|nr:type VII secretion protein EssC [Butyrivibrio hungatei]